MAHDNGSKPRLRPPGILTATHVMSNALKKKRKLIAQKRMLQRAFLKQAKAEGLTPSQAVKRASIFPSGAKLKVVTWPKF